MVRQRKPGWLKKAGLPLSDIYDEWEKAPLEPGALAAHSSTWPEAYPFRYKVQDRDTLKSIADDISRSEFPGFTWEVLTEYNWKTRDPEEVNWCLEFFTGCNVATDDGLNWRFKYRIPPASPSEWKRIWVPVIFIPLEPLPPPYRGHKTRPVTIDTRRCIHLENDGTCAKISTHPQCRPPHAGWKSGTTVDIGEGPGFGKRILQFFFGAEPEVADHEEQTLKESVLVFTKFKVESHFDPVQHPPKATSGAPPDLGKARRDGTDFTWEVASLNLSFDRAHTAGKAKVDPKSLKKGSVASPANVGDKLPIPPLSATYRDDSAHSIGDLIILSQAGVVSRVFLRGCCSWDEGNGRQTTYDLSLRRAQRLKKLLKDEKVLGLVEPEVIPCSDHHSSARSPKIPTDRRVAVELEFQPPPRTADEQPETVASIFTFVRYTDSKTGKTATRLLYYPPGGTGSKAVYDQAELDSLRRGALAALEAFRHSVANAVKLSARTRLEALEEAKAWVTNEWQVSGGGPVPELSRFYFLDLKNHPPGQTTVKIWDLEVEVSSAGSAEADDAPRNINHSRCGESVGVIEASIDNLSRTRIVRWAQSPRDFPVENYDFVFDEGAP